MESDLPELSVGTNWPKIVLISLGVLCGAAIVAAVMLAPPPPFSPKPGNNKKKAPETPSVLDDAAKYEPPSDTGYVGSARCAGCHDQIADSFKSHPMANSAALLDASSVTPEQLQQTRVLGKQRVLDVEVRDGVLEHHERMFDAQGVEIYDQAVPMKYSFGSGRRAKAYVHQQGDALFMSPLNWYSQAAKWDLAPNYKPDDDRRFDRRVTDECLSCHTGRLNPLGRSLNRYKTPVFHELSIGCENCHGPGEKHVAFREKGETGPDPIVNPAKLEPVQRDGVCNQCHLQTAVRSPRYGRSHLDFRPGMGVQNVWAFLDTHLGVSKDGTTRSVNHVQQMRQSRCYTFSDGKFSCTSCHDPHGVPTPEARVDFYRQRCSKCHKDGDCTAPREQRQKEQDSCIACHMPSRNSKNISHVSQTDHRVLKNPKEANKATPEDDDEELKLIVEDPFTSLADWEQQRALGLGAWIYLTKSDRVPPQSLAKTLLGVRYKVPDDPDVLLALGSIATHHKLMDRANEYYHEARKLPAAEEESLLGLLNIYYMTETWEPALEYADRLLKITPFSAKVHALRAEVLHKVGRDPEAIKAAETALQLNPSLIPVREWLINGYKALGLTDKQREQEDIVKRIKEARLPLTPKKTE